MKSANIYISQKDASRLRGLLRSRGNLSASDNENYRDLQKELDRAVVLPSDELPADVITMKSRFRLKDLDTGTVAEYELVFPGSSDIGRGKISVTAPIGTALLGYRESDTIEWKVPAGLKRFRIEAVLSQPNSRSANAA